MLKRRLRLIVALILCPFASVHAETVSGAFGIRFGTAIAVSQLGDAVPGAPPPAPFEWTLPDDAPATAHARWFAFAPTAVPLVLDDVAGEFRVHFDDDAMPLRVVAHFSNACESKSGSLASILAQKYPRLATAPESPAGAAWFGTDDTRVGLFCNADGKTLVLDYVDVARYRVWEAITRDAYAVWQESEAAARAAEAERIREEEEQRRREHAAEAERIAREEAARAEQLRLQQEEAARIARRELIEQLIAGSARRIDRVFGIRFREPFTEIPSFTPDVVIPLTRPGIAAPFDDARFTIELDPDGVPIRVRGTARIADADRIANTLGEALREKHGAPMKDSPRHKIFDVSGDYLIVKQLGSDELELVAINQHALQIQRRRLREAAARAEADRERRFEQETRGL